MKTIRVGEEKVIGNKGMFDLINQYSNNSLVRQLEEAEEVSCATYPGLLEEGSIFDTIVYGNGTAWSLLLKKVQERMPKKIEEIQKWAHEVLQIDDHLKNAYSKDEINNQMIVNDDDGENGKVENASDLLSQLMTNLI